MFFEIAIFDDGKLNYVGYVHNNKTRFVWLDESEYVHFLLNVISNIDCAHYSQQRGYRFFTDNEEDIEKVLNYLDGISVLKKLEGKNHDYGIQYPR